MYIIKKLRQFLVLTTLVLISVCGCSKKPHTNTEANPSPETTGQTVTESRDSALEKPKDKPIPEFQLKLLEMAFETASAIPVQTHIKDRSKAQESVVEMCLKLDQPIRAIQYANRIDSWERGLSYAKTAFYLAKKGYPIEQLQKGLDVAEQVAAIDHGQKWRSDRIKAVVVQTYMVLHKPEKIQQFREGLLDSEAGGTVQTEVRENPQISFDDHFKILETTGTIADFEMSKNVFAAYAELFDRYYDEIDKRDSIKVKVDTLWEKKKLPVNFRLEFLMKLTQISIAHKDYETAIKLANETRAFFETYQWTSDMRIPMSANMAKLRYAAGDKEKALEEVEAALALYDEKVDTIWDIYRAETLYPVAEAYYVMGNTQKALAVYKKAVEGSVLNPNIMPRCEDFSAVCRSMAGYAVEPDEQLWSHMNKIKNGLTAQ